VVVEFIYGFIAHSTALMADAGHNVSDVLGLVMAWGAAVLTKRQTSARYTFGLRSSTILAAVLNALLLMLVCGAIALEAIERLASPSSVAGMTVSVVAGIGILINGFSAWMFTRGSKDDLNVRAAYQHMAADAAMSFGVLVSGLIIMQTGWTWLDPLVSIVIVAMILLGTWNLLREAILMVMAAVPANIDPAKVEHYLRQRAGVIAVHDLHIWAMSTTETALMAHLVMPAGCPGDGFINETVSELKRKFAIHHSTLQIEQGTAAHDCALHGKHG